MIFRIIFIVITTLLTNSLLASSNNAWGHGITDFYASLSPTTTHELPAYSAPSSSVGNVDSQTNNGEEYHTFEHGKELPVTVWTLFPGPKSNVDKATLITCKTAAQFVLQHLVARGCPKGF